LDDVIRRTGITRRAWQAGIVTGLGAVLVACGGETAPAAAPTAAKAPAAEPTKAPAPTVAAAAPAPTTAPAPAAKAPVEITYQTFFPQQRLDLLAGSFKIFADKNPSIKANVVFDADHRAKLATQMAADSAPDCFIHDVWSAAKYYEANGILDLTSRLAADKIDLARDYSLIGIEQWCGKAYAVPFYVTSMLLAYNKDILKKFGAPDPWEKWNGQWSWDDFLSVAKQVTKAPGADSPTGTWGLVMDGNGIDNIDRNYQVWMTSNGGETYDVQNMKYTLDDPKSVAAMEFLVRLINDQKVMAGPDEWKKLSDTLGTADPFASGAIAFRQESTGRLALYQQQVAGKFEWDVVPFPSGPGQKFIGHSDADVTNVYAKGKNLDAAYAFAKFLGGEETQSALAQNKLLIPALKKAADDRQTFLKSPPTHMQAFVEPLRSGQFRTSFYHYNGLEALRLQNEQLKRAVMKEISVKDAMTEANRAANGQVKFGSCRQTVTWKTRA
jgi:multiple sugar transport system substrate-binding protein